MSETYDSFESVRARLEAIVDEVNAEGITLDEALKLYEEAVKLGLQACDMSEEEAEAVLAQDEKAAADAVALDEDAPGASAGAEAAAGALPGEELRD